MLHEAAIVFFSVFLHLTIVQHKLNFLSIWNGTGLEAVSAVTHISSRRASAKRCYFTLIHTCTSILWPSWILSGTVQVSRHQKVETNLDLQEQEIASGSGISWAICKSAP